MLSRIAPHSLFICFPDKLKANSTPLREDISKYILI